MLFLLNESNVLEVTYNSHDISYHPWTFKGKHHIYRERFLLLDCYIHVFWFWAKSIHLLLETLLVKQQQNNQNETEINQYMMTKQELNYCISWKVVLQVQINIRKIITKSVWLFSKIDLCLLSNSQLKRKLSTKACVAYSQNINYYITFICVHGFKLLISLEEKLIIYEL